jgi:YD repeat-containing protein
MTRRRLDATRRALATFVAVCISSTVALADDTIPAYSWYAYQGPYFATPAEVCIWARPISEPTLALSIYGDGFCRNNYGAGIQSPPNPGGGYIVPYAFSFSIVERDLTALPQQVCGYGNPIFPMVGAKRERIDLGVNLGWQSLSLTYDTTRRAPLTIGGTPPATTVELPSFGELWLSSLHKRLVIGAANKGARVSRGNGRIVSFAGDGTGGFTPDPGTNDRLVAITGGWLYTDADAQTLETYSTSGQLTRIDRAAGQALTFVYSDSSTSDTIAPAPGYLIRVTDSFGRSVQFEYILPGGGIAATDGRISKIKDPSNHDIAPSYVGTNLSELVWQNGWIRKFHYESTAFPWALTGITDELNQRIGTYGYDGAGRAILTEGPVVIGTDPVNRYSVSYTSPPSVIVSEDFNVGAGVMLRTRSWQAPNAPVITTPRGSTINLGVALVANQPSATSRSQPAGAGCAASTSNTAYDTNGNAVSEDDFNGNRVCRAFDQSRNLETARVEGLANTADCSSVTTASTLPTGSRKVSTQWHPDWRLPTKVAESRRFITYVYNGQPDPFNGNAIASCAPTSALLPGPGSKPIVVLCKRVEQSTSDTNGRLGFGATVQTVYANRQSTWTYNANGQVLTATEPQITTQTPSTTTYVYYADTTADHMPGDLQTVTNAVGKITAYNKYYTSGRLKESTDPNGVVTKYEYDLRQSPTKVEVGGQATLFEYNPVGLLSKVIRPDASFLQYGYDAAHRRMSVADNLGNLVEYALDNSGNLTGEAVRDPGGALKRQLTRVYDALDRVQQVTGSE